MSSNDRRLGGVGRVSLTVLLLVGVALAMSDPVSVVNFLAYAAVGALVATRRPGNPIGWILVAIGFGFIATSSMPDDIEAVKSGTATTADFLAAWVGTWAGGLTFLAYATLAMIFPSGRLPTGPWRRSALGALGLGLGVVAVGAVTPKIPFSPDGGVTNFMIDNRFALIPSIDVQIPVPGEVFIVVPIGIFAVGVVSAVMRYRRVTGIERLQLRWLMASIAFAFAALVVGLVGFATVGPQSGLIWLPALIAYPTVPLSIGIAVMRYRVFEIDRIISRTIAYGAITAVLFVVFGLVNLAMQTALRSVVTGNALAVVVSTLAVAALFSPLRWRLQRVVDRRFNRTHHDQERALNLFATGLRDEVDLERVRSALIVTADEAVRPVSATVWLRRDAALGR
jgi:hypothetical protein